MEYNIIVTASSILLCIFLFIRSILIKISTQKQQKAIAQLEQEISIIKETENREQEFQNSLKHAEVNTKLQKTRSAYTSPKSKLRAPERYGYAQTMFQSGMAAEKIATALGMSGHEINQLLKLAKLRVSS